MWPLSSGKAAERGRGVDPSDMSDPNIEMLRRRLTESENAGAAEIDSAFARLEEKILLLVDTIESAHSVRLEELRQEAARLASGKGGDSDF
jgi:hypothetical protein